MRVLVAPDKFAGTLTAVQAAEAIAEGWRRRAPDDELDLAPMADGGPGFVDVVHAALGGEVVVTTVRGPYGDDTPATFLVAGADAADDRATAYVEAAQACGLHLTPADHRDPERATSYGVGEMLLAARDAGVRRVVLGLGGSATNDGGAGLLAALGARARGGALDAGPLGLDGVVSVDLEPAVEALDGLEVVVASDVDNPLLGLLGATKIFGPQKGVAEERIPALDALLDGYAKATAPRTISTPGAGAAGGLGFAMLALGARRRPGVDVVVDACSLRERARAADLVLTGEGAFDFSSRSGKVPAGVAAVAAEALRPCVALAGAVLLGSREMRTMGVESAYAVVDLVGEAASFADPAGSLATLAERVARSWSRS
jgi:glycerate 2-kinase